MILLVLRVVLGINYEIEICTSYKSPTAGQNSNPKPHPQTKKSLQKPGGGLLVNVIPVLAMKIFVGSNHVTLTKVHFSFHH